MEFLVDPLGECTAYSLDAGQVVDARGEDPLQPAEMLEQLLAARGPDGRDLLEARGGARLAAPRAVAGDRETVRLVAHLLDEVQRGAVGREAPGLVLAGKDQLFHAGLALHALGHADHADLV